MDAGLLRGIFTVMMVILFVGICFWAWSSKAQVGSSTRRRDYRWNPTMAPRPRDTARLPMNSRVLE